MEDSKHGANVPSDHRMTQEMSFIGPDCILQIGFRQKEAGKDIRGKPNDMAGFRISGEVRSKLMTRAPRRPVGCPLP